MCDVFILFNQIMKTWHLICILACITGVGVILITIKTIAQAATEPELVRDSETPDGTTVWHNNN